MQLMPSSILFMDMVTLSEDMPHKPYAKKDGGCNITTSLLGLVKLMALAVWLFSFAFYTGEAEEDEIVMEKRLR